MRLLLRVFAVCLVCQFSQNAYSEPRQNGVGAIASLAYRLSYRELNEAITVLLRTRNEILVRQAEQRLIQDAVNGRLPFPLNEQFLSAQDKERLVESNRFGSKLDIYDGNRYLGHIYYQAPHEYDFNAANPNSFITFEVHKQRTRIDREGFVETDNYQFWWEPARNPGETDGFHSWPQNQGRSGWHRFSVN